MVWRLKGYKLACWVFWVGVGCLVLGIGVCKLDNLVGNFANKLKVSGGRHRAEGWRRCFCGFLAKWLIVWRVHFLPQGVRIFRTGRKQKTPRRIVGGASPKKTVAAAFLFELVTPQLNNKEPLPTTLGQVGFSHRPIFCERGTAFQALRP